MNTILSIGAIILIALFTIGNNIFSFKRTSNSKWEEAASSEKKEQGLFRKNNPDNFLDLSGGSLGI